ncbi:hypothetical protein K503DRAFT_806689 [Rhizopogon vinicolor AM-OR11-026]|uniref:Uncharacterized protein n=1 Tax=Rhizopogon vinicolor AM-OR11-026 TaxID=1314800 RepID=A0A1B7MDY9_9AGAM|nr:hypothetical protein K503DRAFT_806689 [Rhizopogon vinicolor AM-OR11-026]
MSPSPFFMPVSSSSSAPQFDGSVKQSSKQLAPFFALVGSLDLPEATGNDYIAFVQAVLDYYSGHDTPDNYFDATDTIPASEDAPKPQLTSLIDSNLAPVNFALGALPSNPIDITSLAFGLVAPSSASISSTSPDFDFDAAVTSADPERVPNDALPFTEALDFDFTGAPTVI